MGREGLTGEGRDKPSGAHCRISARLGRVCALQVGVEVNEPWGLAFPRLLPLPTSAVAPPGAAWAPHRASVAGWDPVLKRPRPSRVGGQDRPLAARGPCAQAGRRRPCPAGPRDGGARVGSRPPAQERRGVVGVLWLVLVGGGGERVEAAGSQAGALSARAAWWGALSTHPQRFALRAWCCTPALGGFQRWASRTRRLWLR